MSRINLRSRVAMVGIGMFCLVIAACDVLDDVKERLGMEPPKDFRMEIRAMKQNMQAFKQATADAMYTAKERSDEN